MMMICIEDRRTTNSPIRKARFMISMPPEMIGCIGFGPAVLGDADKFLKDDGHADGGDERRQAERAAQGPVGDALDGPVIGATK